MPADISVCLGLTQPLKMSTRMFLGVKAAGTLPPSCAQCLAIWSLNRPEPFGPHRPVIGIALPLGCEIRGEPFTESVTSENVGFLWRLVYRDHRKVTKSL